MKVKTIRWAMAFMLSFLLLGCTTKVVTPPPPPDHPPPPPLKRPCKKVWVPGHFDRFGIWVPGHWKKKCP